MSAAITVMVIFTISTIVVRLASTIMRLTGLPDNVARFQSLSALTGTGFTTRESELIVNYPIRRRVLMTLMIFGNLGLISISSTFIITFVQIGPETGRVIGQIALLGGALLLNFLILTNPYVDQLLCSTISKILSKTTSLGRRKFVRLLSLDDDMAVSEHHYRMTESTRHDALFPDDVQLTLLTVRGETSHHIGELEADFVIEPFQTLVCFGSEDMHQKFAAYLRAHDALDGEVPDAHQTTQG